MMYKVISCTKILYVLIVTTKYSGLTLWRQWITGVNESENDPECIFFTINTFQVIFISDILWFLGVMGQDRQRTLEGRIEENVEIVV